MALKLGPDLRVLLVDGNGTALSVGGGTQYADGDVQATPSGNVVMWNDAGTVRATSAAKPLPVAIISGAGGTVTDAAAWTTAVSTFVPSGGVFNDSAAVLVSGTQGTQRLTANRAQHVNLRTAAGTEIGALSNNGAAPVALTQVGVLPAVATAAVPTYTEGRQGLLSMDLSGFQRGIVMGSSGSGATAVGVNPVLIGMNGAGAFIRFFTEANAVAGTTGTGLVGVNAMVFDGTNYQKMLGDSSGNLKQIGTKTTNAAVPGATNIGTLSAIANAAAPTLTETFQTGLSIDLTGNLRTLTTAAKLEDAGHTTGDAGNFILAVRQDTQSALAGTTLDYIPITTDAVGSARVVAAGYTTVVTTTLTRPADTTAYAAGDEMTDTGGAIQTITGAARYTGGSGVIMGIYVSQSTLWTTKPQMEVWIYDTTSTPVADNGAFAPTDAVTDTCIAVVPVTSTYAGTVNQALDSGTISVPFVTVGSANLYARIVIRNAAQDSANSGVTKFRFRISCD